MKPSIGRIVIFAVTAALAAEINAARKYTEREGNPVYEGQKYAATIVSVWGDQPTSAVNLKVHLDGNDDHWVTSVSNTNGDSGEIKPGTWGWPPRV